MVGELGDALLSAGSCRADLRELVASLAGERSRTFVSLANSVSAETRLALGVLVALLIVVPLVHAHVTVRSWAAELGRKTALLHVGVRTLILNADSTFIANVGLALQA